MYSGIVFRLKIHGGEGCSETRRIFLWAIECPPPRFAKRSGVSRAGRQTKRLLPFGSRCAFIHFASDQYSSSHQSKCFCLTSAGTPIQFGCGCQANAPAKKKTFLRLVQRGVTTRGVKDEQSNRWVVIWRVPCGSRRVVGARHNPSERRNWPPISESQNAVTPIPGNSRTQCLRQKILLRAKITSEIK